MKFVLNLSNLDIHPTEKEVCARGPPIDILPTHPNLAAMMTMNLMIQIKVLMPILMMVPITIIQAPYLLIGWLSSDHSDGESPGHVDSNGASKNVEEEEKKEDEEPELPPYLPAIQGCRSVEEFSV